MFVTADITVSNDIVTVTGATSVGAHKIVTILVTNQMGNIEYISEKESETAGQYNFTFKMSSTTQAGTYLVKVSGEGISTPTLKEYIYGEIMLDTIAPTAPTNLTVTNVTGSTVDLSWTASTDNVGVVGYDVYKDGVKIATVTNIGCQVTGLATATTYKFTVKLNDASDNISLASNEIIVVTVGNNQVTADITVSNEIVTVVNVHLSDSLMTLAYKIRELQNPN